MHVRIPYLPGNCNGGPGWRSRHRRSLAVRQIFHACQSSSFPRLIGPVGEESLLSLRHWIPSRPSCLKVLLQEPPPRANIAPHTRYSVLLPHVMKVITNHLAKIACPHYGYIGPHCGQSIDRCIPVIHRVFIREKDRDWYLLCSGDRPRIRSTFNFEHPCNDTLLQSGKHRQVTLKRELDPICFESTCEHTDFTQFEVTHLELHPFIGLSLMPLLTQVIMDVSLVHPWGIGSTVLIFLSLELANE